MWTSCLQSVILLCFIFIYIFTIHKSPSHSELSQALTLPSFMICYHLTKFSWYIMAMAVIIFPFLYLCQTILKNKFKSIYRILSWLASLYIRWFHSCSKVLIYKEVILFPMKCIKLFFIYVYTKYISCYCNVLLLIFIIII